MGRRTMGYMRSIGARKVILVSDPILMEERTVGLYFKRGHTRINIST
jgi:hypothetical protein